MANVVMFSGGVASYCAAKRVLDRDPEAALLFADTKMEDEDLYRFLDDCGRRLNREIVRVADGRTPWQLFHEQGMIGNTRADFCSRILKRELLDNWITENIEDPTVHFGFDASEAHRLEGVRKVKPYRCDAPLMWEPIVMFKQQMFDELEADGIELPRLYQLGFSHNNCGGFCIKAGQGHFARLFEKMPERYKAHETQEAAFNAFREETYAVLRDRRGGATKPMTLEQFRKRLQGGADYDSDDEGGCNCFAPPVEDA